MGWPFCFCGNPNNVLLTLLIMGYVHVFLSLIGVHGLSPIIERLEELWRACKETRINTHICECTCCCRLFFFVNALHWRASTCSCPLYGSPILPMFLVLKSFHYLSILLWTRDIGFNWLKCRTEVPKKVVSCRQTTCIELSNTHERSYVL